MLVMLSCGPSSNQIVKTVSSQIDNVDFHCYYKVDEFINQSKLRHLAFDRLVFTSKFINNDKDMGKLCDYIRKELNSSEIVMILPKSQKSLEDLFKKYFDSPMYTVMYVDSPTTMCIVDAIKLSIVDVKARYYFFDKPEEGNDKKSSKFGMFKGGKKNKSQKPEIQNSDSESSSNAENIGEVDTKENSEFGFETVGEDLSNTGKSDIDLENPNFRNSENSEFSFDSSISDEDKKENGLISQGTSDDLDLSIGEYGSQHTDSGFVGDDDLDELRQFAEQMGNVPEDINAGDKEKENVPIENNTVEDIPVEKTPIERTAVKDVPVNRPKKEKRLNLIDESKVNIITGVNGSGVTAYIVNTAIGYSKIGKKVLIIDLDYLNNGILSFIDVNKFYRDGCYQGINKGVIYTEDGVDVLSNGYNTSIDISLDVLLSNFNGYDIVIIDCPLELLNIIPDSVLCNSNIVIGCISDLSKLIETSAKISDRSYVSFEKEKYISKNVKVANRNISKNDIECVKNMMMFPNGCWLDNM